MANLHRRELQPFTVVLALYQVLTYLYPVYGMSFNPFITSCNLSKWPELHLISMSAWVVTSQRKKNSTGGFHCPIFCCP